jgi:cytochrome c peroxidase
MTQGIRSHLVAHLKWHSRSLCLLVSFIFVCLLLLKSAMSLSESSRVLTEPSVAASREPITPLPLSVDLDPKRVALGEQLFNDVRLSRDNTKSCATCHPLEQGGMDGRRRATSANDSQPARNTPTIFNVGLNASFNWDGIADSLEAQAEIVLLSPRLMNATWPELLAKLRDADYVARFNDAFPEGLTQANVLAALADFQRSLLTPNARFDRYLRGERDALTEAEQQGYTLFKSYGCVACHQGMNIGGNMYQKFGVFAETSSAEMPVDLGRYAVTKAQRDREVFRVPSLRNVAVTSPYFHDGRAPTLEEAVTTMVRVQLGRTLTSDEVRLIVQFLDTLTGEYRGRPVETPAKKRQ